jgi:hypothetical protein
LVGGCEVGLQFSGIREGEPQALIGVSNLPQGRRRLIWISVAELKGPFETSHFGHRPEGFQQAPEGRLESLKWPVEGLGLRGLGQVFQGPLEGLEQVLRFVGQFSHLKPEGIVGGPLEVRGSFFLPDQVLYRPFSSDA